MRGAGGPASLTDPFFELLAEECADLVCAWPQRQTTHSVTIVPLAIRKWPERRFLCRLRPRTAHTWKAGRLDIPPPKRPSALSNRSSNFSRLPLQVLRYPTSEF